jgi:AcrR family transcriptional regulator
MSTFEGTGLRERNKAKRRDAILDAALQLLEGPEPASMTTERIAELAEVSAATVYNLIGTREQLLLALIDRVIEGAASGLTIDGTNGDPFAELRHVVELGVRLLTSRPAASRQIVLQLTAAANPEMHTRLSPATAFAAGIRRAQAAGHLRDDFDADALALQMYLSFNGALLRWAAGVLSDAAFRAAALHGVIVVLAVAATPGRRSALLRDLQVLAPELVG